MAILSSPSFGIAPWVSSHTAKNQCPETRQRRTNDPRPTQTLARMLAPRTPHTPRRPQPTGNASANLPVLASRTRRTMARRPVLTLARMLAPRTPHTPRRPQPTGNASVNLPVLASRLMGRQAALCSLHTGSFRCRSSIFFGNAASFRKKEARRERKPHFLRFREQGTLRGGSEVALGLVDHTWSLPRFR